MPPPLDFRAIFDASPNAYMLLDRELRYVDMNPAYLRATATPRREDLIGRKLFEAFPHDPDDSSNPSARLVRASLERVLATGQPDVLAVVPYRIPVTGPDGATRFEEHTWSATHSPLFAPDGSVAYVLQHTARVTELEPTQSPAARVQGDLAPTTQLGADLLGRARIVQARLVTLDAELSQLRRVFEQAPGFVCYLRGPEHVFALANAAYYQLVGHRDILNRTVRDALPEVAGQGFYELLDRVYATGEPFVGRAVPVHLQREAGAPLVRACVDFVYQPIVDATGRVNGIFVQGQDITLQKRYEEERERLGAIVEQSSDFIGIADAALNVVFVNEAGRRLVGLDGAGIAARRLTDFFAPEDPAFVSDVLQPALARDGRWEGEFRLRAPGDDAPIEVYFTAFALREPRLGIAVVARDIRAHKRLERERAALLERERAARGEAEAANRAKDEFLATMSHELRTPLTAILGWTRMLRAGTLPPERQERALETIERNAQSQAALIEDVLDVARIVSGKLRLDIASVVLASLVEAAVETLRPAADARGVRVQLLLDPDAGTTQGDAARLQQVAWNLISNAVKFTPRGGRVFVRLARRASHVELVVEDTGQGIDPAFLPFVFERFRQADATITRQHGGLGLGLAIVRHLVELHGGTITAASEGPGRGATFTVRLPIAPVRAAPTPDVPRPVARGIDCPPGLAGLRVLVLDDEPDARDLLAVVLGHCKAHALLAATAREALGTLRSERPDVIVSDIGMPGEDGYAFIRAVRALPPAEGGRTPAVALTAYARSEDRTRALVAGFSNHVAKPVDPNELLAVIASLAGRYATHE